MKSLKLIAILSSLLLLSYCSDDDATELLPADVPDTFTIDIPSSISSATGDLSGRADGDGDGYIEGNEIYESLRGFIYIGETSAEILEFVLEVGAGMELAGVRTFTFTGDADGREKRIDITENVSRGGLSFEYEMTMVDTENDEQALQLLWNTNPVAGVAILNPYQIERDNSMDADVFLQINYSEDVTGYDAVMQVAISGLPAVDNGDIDNMALFVGKNGDQIDVIGNSNHPNLIIVDDTFTGGRNYAFVGRGDETLNIGVVKLALPPSSTDTNDVLDMYSVYSVLEGEINSVGITDQAIIDGILAEAHSPAYFDSSGFLTSGVDNKPSNFSDTFVDLTGLSPFVPNEVKNLSIGFVQ